DFIGLALAGRRIQRNVGAAGGQDGHQQRGGHRAQAAPPRCSLGMPKRRTQRKALHQVILTIVSMFWVERATAWPTSSYCTVTWTSWVCSRSMSLMAGCAPMPSRALAMFCHLAE